MKIDTKLIKELAGDIEKYNLEEITLESEGTKVTLKRETVSLAPSVIQPNMVSMAAPAAPVRAAATKSIDAKQEDVSATETYPSVDSPMIGTFYKSPAPGAAPFIKEGDMVSAGDTLCIVEAMKLMNEVKTDKSGKVVKILVQDGKPVKKGEKLILIDTNA